MGRRGAGLLIAVIAVIAALALAAYVSVEPPEQEMPCMHVDGHCVDPKTLSRSTAIPFFHIGR